MGRRFLNKKTGEMLSAKRRISPRTGKPWYTIKRGDRVRRTHCWTMAEDDFRKLGWISAYYGENLSRMIGKLVCDEYARIQRGEDLV